jgi:Svf1-like protein
MPVRVWYPTIQFTFKVFNPKTGEKTWRSVNVSNFVTPPPELDKRSSRADEFTITHADVPGTDYPELYTITANLTQDVKISLEVRRPTAAPGFKIGRGPDGGYSYFGPDATQPDGYVVHRFWPLTRTSGEVIVDGKPLAIDGPGMFVHAIQGMRPNLVASRWNFAHFQSPAHGGVSAVQMEFTTTSAYGRKGAGSGYVSVNVGGLVIGGKLATVTAETKWPDEAQPEQADLVSRAQHVGGVHDPETGYPQPTGLVFRWAAPSVVPDAPGSVEGTLTVDVGSPSETKGLIEKVDVLAEIPTVVKAVVNYVAGTKPYIYQVSACAVVDHQFSRLTSHEMPQWINPAKLVLRGPDLILPGLAEGLEVEGFTYNEATFISE